MSLATDLCSIAAAKVSSRKAIISASEIEPLPSVGTAHYNETTPHVTGFAPAGNIYVPTQCASGAVKCKLHLSLHGCGEMEYYDEAVHHLGFQEWGEANDIVILYPRVKPHGGTTESASGCYDGYAQSGADYALKSGAQMSGVRKMIAAVGGPKVNE